MDLNPGCNPEPPPLTHSVFPPPNRLVGVRGVGVGAATTHRRDSRAPDGLCFRPREFRIPKGRLGVTRTGDLSLPDMEKVPALRDPSRDPKGSKAGRRSRRVGAREHQGSCVGTFHQHLLVDVYFPAHCRQFGNWRGKYNSGISAMNF